MSDIVNAVRDALGNYHYICLYGIAIVLLMALLKQRRKAFVVPCVLISFIVLNPIFYKVWNAVNNYGYWRTLWMIPVIPICAAVPAVLVEKGKKQWINGALVVFYAVIFMYAGTFIYQNPLTSFTKPENKEKLPNNAILLADALLELDDTPFVVADDEICIFLRQYSGKIRTLYARDMFYWTPSEIARRVYDQLSSDEGDLQEVAQIMLNYDYDYLIANNVEKERKSALEKAGFEFVRRVNEYSIYRVTGKPTEIRTYNKLHQVLSKTYVDENGNAMYGPDGYATRTYVYDRMGRVIRRFQTDTNGDAALDDSGKAGFERTYDRFGQVLSETWLGADGNEVEAGGYATRKCTYDKNNQLISESYFDVAGEPMIRTDKLFAEKRMTYDDGNKTSEKYYGLDGKLIISSSGYAGYEREYDEKGQLIKESYINADDDPAVIEAGYCAFEREYDDAGNVSAEYYLDENGERTLCAKGYAFIGREYNENGKVIHEWYEDPQGDGIVTSDGYAGFWRVYDTSGNVIEQKYLDTKGNEAPAEQGFSRVCRKYDAKDQLITENYFNGSEPFTLSSGYAGFTHSYDTDGNLLEEKFFDANGEAVITKWGYAAVKHVYDGKGRRIEDYFYDIDGGPVVIEPGYSKCVYIYTEDDQLSLVYYMDLNNHKVEAGSGYFHDYLQSLKGRDISILIGVRDEASSNMTVTLYNDMLELGIHTDLRGQYRKSFYAVVTPEGTIEELSDEKISINGKIGDVSYSVVSAGCKVGASCSIIVDGKEYSKNERGLNIVVFDNNKKRIVDTIAFDTCAKNMKVTR